MTVLSASHLSKNLPVLLWGPFCGAAVGPNMLNMPKSASGCYYALNGCCDLNIVTVLSRPIKIQIIRHRKMLTMLTPTFHRRGSKGGGAPGARPLLYSEGRRFLKNSFTLICNFTHNRLRKISVSGSLIASSTQFFYSV